MARNGRRATSEERIRAVQLLEDGRSLDDVADVLGVSRSAVFDWQRKYRAGGLAALSTKFASGRPTTLSDDQMVRSLWRILRPTAPQMVHTPSSWWERLSMQSRLFWRMMEINDWMHQLRTARDSAIAGMELPDGNKNNLVGDAILAAAEVVQMREVVVSERERLIQVARSLDGVRWASAPTNGSIFTLLYAQLTVAVTNC